MTRPRPARPSITRRVARAALRHARERARARVRKWKRSYVGGGRHEVEAIHQLMREAERLRTHQRGTPPMSTSPGPMLDEGRPIVKAAAQIGMWVPVDAIEVHAEIITVYRSIQALAAGVLDWTETLARMSCDARVIDALAGVSTLLTQAAVAGVNADRRFCQLYAGDLAQAEAPARTMHYPTPAGAQ